MNVRDLIFDWKKPDGRRRDKLYAFLVVSALFATFAAVVELRLPAPPSGTAQSAEVMRFAEEGMARSWLRDAEENGPFPGRLQVEAGKGTALVPFGGQLDAWTDYRASLRPLPTQDGLERIEITPKGRRVFPVIPGPELSAVDKPESRGQMRRVPILLPYDRGALRWIPEEIPHFELPEGSETVPDSLRFALSLRNDGGVAEVIPLAGGNEPAQEAVQSWLRGVRFKEGDGERWFGLRIEFENRRNHGSQPE